MREKVCDQAYVTFHHYNITVYSSTCSKERLLVIFVFINYRNSLVLFGGLHFPVLLGTSWLLGRWAGIFTIITVTWLLSVVVGALVLKVVLIFVFFVVLSVLSLGLLGLLLRSWTEVR